MPWASRTCSDGIMKPGHQGSSERRHHSPGFPSSAESRGHGSPCSRELWAWALAETEPVILAWWLHQPRAVAPCLGSEPEPPLCEHLPLPNVAQSQWHLRGEPREGKCSFTWARNGEGSGLWLWARLGSGSGDNGARLVPTSPPSIRGWDGAAKGRAVPVSQHGTQAVAEWVATRVRSRVRGGYVQRDM